MTTEVLFDNATPPADPGATELLGSVARTEQTWENDDGGTTVLARLESGQKVRGRIGAGGVLRQGRCYRFLGRWEDHARWGWQFAFQSHVEDVPEDLAGVAAYLAKWCDGVGPATAAKLVEAYGADTARVLTEDPGRVAADGLLGEGVARAASETLAKLCAPAWRDAHLDLFRLFRGHGFYGKALHSCLLRWRERAPQVVRRDPFALLVAEIPGCGFARCDRLYSSLGLDPSRLKRQALAAWHALRQRDGDTWLSLGDALAAVRDAIGGARPRERRAVAMALRARWLGYRMTGGGAGHWLAERDKAASERDVALRVKALSEGKPAWPEIDPAHPAFARLSDHQRGQLAAATVGRVCVLTGSPGTGKTFAAAALIQALLKVTSRAAIAVAAPTGKAAVRITEKMQEFGLPLQAATVHRLLGPLGGDGGKWAFRHGADNPLPFRFVVVDEVSMVDVDLAAALLRACGREAHLLLVGDRHQLPPVGHGAFLRDLIAGGVPTARLTEIRRNAGDIVHACAMIKDGVTPDMAQDLAEFPGRNLIHLATGRGTPSEKQEMAKEKIDAVYDWLKADGERNLIDDVQVIVARNATRQLLNRHLQQKLNPEGARGPAGCVFRLGDKVICLKNGLLGSPDSATSEYVANGEIGRVERFDGRRVAVRLSAPSRRVFVPLRKTDREQNGEANGEEGAAGDWDLAYACTCHKFQGSECPVVVVLVEGAGKLGSREWIYTALSRAKELCVVVGERAEISRYTRNETLPERKTFLAEMLRGEVAA